MQEKYDFFHGRYILALLYGLIIGATVTILFVSIVEAVYSLDSLFDDYTVFAVTGIILLMFSPFFYIIFLPPDRLKINVKCTGILHDDCVEIHKGKKIKKQAYKDIKHVLRISIVYVDYWLIGKVSIHQSIGLRKKHRNADVQLERFAKAVESRIQIGDAE